MSLHLSHCRETRPSFVVSSLVSFIRDKKSQCGELALLFVTAATVRTLSRVRLFAAPWTVAHQAPLSMDFSGKNTGMGCHFQIQGIFPIVGNNMLANLSFHAQCLANISRCFKCGLIITCQSLKVLTPNWVLSQSVSRRTFGLCQKLALTLCRLIIMKFSTLWLQCINGIQLELGMEKQTGSKLGNRERSTSRLCIVTLLI